MSKVKMSEEIQIFHEAYSVYYNTVAAILKQAVHKPVDKKSIYEIIKGKAFDESINFIPVMSGDKGWKLWNEDGSTDILGKPTMPLTTLQRRWIKAISMDPRIKLFGDFDIELPDVEPLYRQEDIIVFDKYEDGDAYTDENYIRNFRLILDAIRKKQPVEIEVDNRRGEQNSFIVMPDHLEYSEKDDKFRLIGYSGKQTSTINLNRITECRVYGGKYEESDEKLPVEQSELVLELVDEKNALERVLIHFSHFEKKAEKVDDKHYRITLVYDKDDESEMIIRVLSFGAMIRVIEPECFVEKMKDRLKNQKNCGLTRI